jgi:hypothetical protein
MRIVVCVAALAGSLGACASPPVVREPVISPTGEFRGPVVSDRGVPRYASYEGYCNLETGRWTHGGYRAYTPQPCDRASRRGVVRALY